MPIGDEAVAAGAGPASPLRCRSERLSTCPRFALGATVPCSMQYAGRVCSSAHTSGKSTITLRNCVRAISQISENVIDNAEARPDTRTHGPQRIRPCALHCFGPVPGRVAVALVVAGGWVGMKECVRRGGGGRGRCRAKGGRTRSAEDERDFAEHVAFAENRDRRPILFGGQTTAYAQMARGKQNRKPANQDARRDHKIYDALLQAADYAHARMPK